MAEFSNNEDEKEQAENKLALLTPIAKAFMTETGESAKHGMQIFGGHGYIAEHGMEQIARDARIACLYEGTTEIQAIDLLARKVIGSKGNLLKALTDEIQEFTAQHQQHDKFSAQVQQLEQLVKEWLELTRDVVDKMQQRPEEIGAAAVDYLYFSGYTVFAYLWAKWRL